MGLHLSVGRRATAASALLFVAVLIGALAPGPAGATIDDPLRYVALGDSYTSSPLTGLFAGQPLGCFRSDNNYPHVAAAALGPDTFIDVSCGGATTADFFAPQSVFDGDNPPQLDALTADTTVVTIGISGNDIGFGEIVQACVSLLPFGHPCLDRYTAGGVDQLAQRIASTAALIDNVLTAVHDRAPDADVFVVGYPTILPDTGPGCWPVVPYTRDDVAYLRATEHRLNAMLADRAAAHGDHFVDTYTSSIGHDVCQLPLVKWVEGLIPTSPAAPVHPNALGSRDMGNQVVAAMAAAGIGSDL
ncbi:MAG: SGNH/GDSL hydrolase family protein [Acidimicrobiales bacterium]